MTFPNFKLKKTTPNSRSCGQVVKLVHSALAALGFHWFGSWTWTWHRSSGRPEAASHIAQQEALTTRVYNYVMGGFGEKEKKNYPKYILWCPRLLTSTSHLSVFQRADQKPFLPLNFLGLMI